MDLQESLAQIKINWNKFYIFSDGGTIYERNDLDKFMIKPEEFLKFAKEDCRNLNKMSLINAISNAKRAIDCQIDWILSYLGDDYSNFNDKEYPEIKAVIDEYKFDMKSQGSVKIKFIQALNIASGFLISKIRKVRNNLEHEYKLPSNDEVREAVEVAELFINATQNILINKMFTSYYVKNEIGMNSDYRPLGPHIIISFEKDNNKQTYFEIWYSENRSQVVVHVKDKEYISLLKVAISKECYYLPSVFGCKIERKYINYEIE